MISSNEKRKSEKKDPVVDEVRELINEMSGQVEEAKVSDLAKDEEGKSPHN